MGMNDRIRVSLAQDHRTLNLKTSLSSSLDISPCGVINSEELILSATD